jgi:2,3,4,5-tetrahydropyridine-2-carboxylate N-succinyltransferase
MTQQSLDLSRYPAIDHIFLVRVHDGGGGLVAVLPNLPAHGDALRVFHGVQDRDGRIGPEQARKGLETLQPAGLDKGNPIADLLHAAQGKDGYSLTVIASPVPGLMARVSERTGEQKEADAFIDLLNAGDIRAAEKVAGKWEPQPYVIDGILNAFRVLENRRFEGGWWDKIPLKTPLFTEQEFEASGVRYAPGCQVRTGTYIGPGTVIMNQAFVNIGAYIAGDGVMIDGAARVASCAQIGKGVKFGAGAGIEGVLEPAGRLPSIVEDHARIGAMCEVAGIVGENSVVASGVVMASGKKIYDEATGEQVPPLEMTIDGTTYLLPVIPPNRLAVGGSVLSEGGKFATDAIILKPGDLRDRDTLRHFEKQGILYQ